MTEDVKNSEVKELKRVLKKYRLSKEDTKEVSGMLEYPYQMLSESNKMNAALEAYLKDMLGDGAIEDFFDRFITRRMSAGKHLKAFIEEDARHYREALEREQRFVRIK